MYVLTENGRHAVERFIKECEAKRKELIDARKDTADETELPTIDDIVCDINFDGIDSDGDYYNGWGVTDHYSLTIGLSYDEHFVEEKKITIEN